MSHSTVIDSIVIFDINDITLNDINFEKLQKNNNKKIIHGHEQKFNFSSMNMNNLIDPYQMNRNDVHIRHFRDACLYDHETIPGFIVQYWKAKREYQKWLRQVRKIPGWERFRRPIRIHYEEPYDDGTFIITKKSIQNNQAIQKIRNEYAGQNKNTSNLSQSKIKGVRPDDEDYRPKMFTVIMGQYISKLRNEAKLTQIELGKKINVEASIIRNIELGELIPFNSEDAMVKALAKVLGVPSIKYEE